MIFDATGDIILDAGGDDITFKSGGTEFGGIFKNSNDMFINSAISDGDIKFRGNDGGSFIIPMVIDMSEGGRVGIGTTSPSMELDVRDDGTNGIAEIGVRGGTNGAGAVQISGHGTTYGSTSFDLIQNSTGAFIQHRANLPLVFATNDTERMRIDSSGNLIVAGTSVGAEDSFGVDSSGIVTIARASGVGRNMMLFKNGGSDVGSISTNTSATAYNTSSDARLKDVTGSARGLEVINELNPVAYNWKADGKADEGLIAQEVLDVVPNAVSGSEEDMYQMDYSKLVTHLVKAVQEQQEQIESLTSEIAILKEK
jgi:hypothetical protein